MAPTYLDDPETCSQCESKLEVKNRKAKGNDRLFKCPKEDCGMRAEEWLSLEHWYPLQDDDEGYMAGFLP